MIRQELQEIFYEPALMLIERLDENQHLLSFDELMMLEKLKFSIHMYEMKKAQEKGLFKSWGKGF